MSWPNTLQEAIIFFGDDANCQRFMIAIRWADGKIRCPQCGSEQVAYLKNVRRYKCYGKHPKAQFSLKVGTIFEDSPLGLDKWLPAVWLIGCCKNGISSYELSRDLQITQKSCWFMLHRIRVAMRTGTFEKLSGAVEADETLAARKVVNMHLDKQTRMRMGKKRTGGSESKAVVMGLLERNTKSAREGPPEYSRLPCPKPTSLITSRRARPFTATRCALIGTCLSMVAFMNSSITWKRTFAGTSIRTGLRTFGVSSRERLRHLRFGRAIPSASLR